VVEPTRSACDDTRNEAPCSFRNLHFIGAQLQQSATVQGSEMLARQGFMGHLTLALLNNRSSLPDVVVSIGSTIISGSANYLPVVLAGQ
jgi:hypothetical protein